MVRFVALQPNSLITRQPLNKGSLKWISLGYLPPIGLIIGQLPGLSLVTTVSRNALVPYSAAEMYSLINDVDAYSTFLPWCREARILFQDEDEIRATIHFSKRGIDTSFTTRNRLQKNKMIEVRLIEGPFHHLQGFWRFEPLGETASKVSLDMEFELSNTLLSMVVGPVFTQIANALVDAFVKRAREVYGYR